MVVFNPFDFFLDEYAEQWPFTYDSQLDHELQPIAPAANKVADFGKPRQVDWTKRGTVDALIDMNRLVQQNVGYTIRMEPGIQTPEETLTKGTGSCRDSTWLLVQLLRHSGLAARFVSGYLIQLTPDKAAVDGPNGAATDFTDLHAWCEVFIPGAGWIGLDPTSGLLAGEGHIPLACSPDPSSAAPISGAHDKAEVEHKMQVTGVTDRAGWSAYEDSDWQTINLCGKLVTSPESRRRPTDRWW